MVLQYLQGVRGHSPLIAAVSVLPLAATMVALTTITLWSLGQTIVQAPPSTAAADSSAGDERGNTG